MLGFLKFLRVLKGLERAGRLIEKNPPICAANCLRGDKLWPKNEGKQLHKQRLL